MRGHWTYLAAVCVLCGCQENNKPAETPTTTTSTTTTTAQPSSTAQPIQTGEYGTPSANPAQSRPPSAGGTYGGSGDTTTWETSGNRPSTATTGPGPSGTPGGATGGSMGSADTSGMGGGSMGQQGGTTGGSMGQQGGTTGTSGATMGGGTSGTSGSMDTADADRKLTRDVRNKINDTPGLSAMAKNITITTSNGKVTLKGQVKSEAERTKIIDVTKKIAGEGQVDDQLTIKKAEPKGGGTQGGGTQGGGMQQNQQNK